MEFGPEPLRAPVTAASSAPFRLLRYEGLYPEAPLGDPSRVAVRMELLHPRCAGIDVHKTQLQVCVRVVEGRTARKDVHEFGTTTAELLRLSEWLAREGVTHVAMEATGSYWKPVWHVLAGTVELLLANPRDVKAVPGRKSDVLDCQWLADLHAHGLIRSSLVPPAPIQELRDLTRTRKQLVRERGRHVQRVHKTLEDANLKLASVITDIMGTSGRTILEAIVAGESDPARLARLGSSRLHASEATLRDALQGRVRPHHRFMLRLHLTQIDGLDAAIRSLEARVEECLTPFRAVGERLATIPGVSATTAAVLVAETGADMSRFPSAGHLVSWAGLCSRLDESAGKPRSRRTRPGQWLKTTLLQAAWAAVKRKNSYFYAKFLRLRRRRGDKKAIVAVAAAMLTAAYHIMRDGTEYQDLGADYFHRFDRAKLATRLIRRLQQLGFDVEAHPTAA